MHASLERKFVVTAEWRQLYKGRVDDDRGEYLHTDVFFELGTCTKNVFCVNCIQKIDKVKLFIMASFKFDKVRCHISHFLQFFMFNLIIYLIQAKRRKALFFGKIRCGLWPFWFTPGMMSKTEVHPLLLWLW